MDRTFFITSVTAQRRTLFQRDAVSDLLVDVFQHYRDQGKYLLHDFVIMPDHFHALVTPANEISLEKAIQFIKGGFSFRLKSRLPVWQPSFTNHRIRDSEDFERHRAYIRMNPVRAGLVAKVEDYPYSSANGRFARPDAAGANALFGVASNAGLKAGSSTAEPSCATGF
jgi:putative transposase